MRDVTGRGWRGEWHLYCAERGEVVRRWGRAGERMRPDDPSAAFVFWTPSTRYALKYKNPDIAKRAERTINRRWIEGRLVLPRNDRGGTPARVRMVSVVTGAAARCLDMINRRDGIIK